jgi:hypothetical protein
MLAEAAGVCLASQGHSPDNTVLVVSGSLNKSYQLLWRLPEPDAVRAYQSGRATEDGAVGIAVLIAIKDLAPGVIEASRTGTGFDWWLGEESDETFQQKGRLEVSGIRNGSDRDINRRVSQKLSQTSLSDYTGLPAYIIVVEFGQPTGRVAEKL